MKFPTVLAVFFTLGVASWAHVGHARTDYAKVTNVTPIYSTVERRIPRKQCWTETVPVKRSYRNNNRSSATPAIIGGVIGGAIGNAVGSKKRNKQIGAVVGSVVGASIGHDIGQQHRRYHHRNYGHVVSKDVERCDVKYRYRTEQQIAGYEVDYRYRGEIYTTTMDYHPGKKIKVFVNVEPADQYHF